MGETHAGDGLVEVDTLLTDITELKLVHHVVVDFLRVEVGSARHRHEVAALISVVGTERCDAVGKTFLYEVFTEVHIVLLANGGCYVDRTLPVGIGNQFEHHQVTLIESTLTLE